ncbi:MAG: TonB-dependent receptor [Pseudomonadota bacterium]
MRFYRLAGASLGAIAAIIAMGSAGAHAAETSVPNKADAQQAKEATEGEVGADTLPDLVISGEKTERSIMDTASSVTVFSEDDIRKRPGIETLNDALENVPSFITTETSNFAPAVRGLDGTGPAQGADAFFAGTRPRLNYMVDGRTLSYNESIFSSTALWDVESVEVFTGPQSTLQGRNSVAGAIVVKTKDPSWVNEAAGRVAFGNYDRQEYSGVVSGPIIKDQLAVRLAVDVRERKDAVDFSPYPEYDHPDRYQSLSLHGKILIEPAAIPDLSTLITLNHATSAAPQDNGVTVPFDDRNAAFPNMPVFGTQTDGGIVDVDYKLSDAWAVKTLVTYTSLRVRRWATAGAGNAEIKADEFAAEPMVNFDYAGIDGFVGVHYFYNDQNELIDLFGGGGFGDTTKTVALFGETTIKATSSLDLTLGGRLEHEERDRSGSAAFFVIDFHEKYDVFLPKATLAWHVTDEQTLGATIARGYNGGGAGFTYSFPFQSYIYEPEYVWNYEVFTRSEFNDGKIVLTGNLFYNQYKDLQLPFDLNPAPAVWSFVVRNADEAETYGAEIGVRALIVDGLTAFANLGLLHTEVTSFPGSGVEGNSFARSPAFALNLGGTYELENGLDFSLNSRFTDTYHSEVVHKARGKTDAYWIADAEIGYSIENARFFATVNNLFDEDAPVMLSPGATPANDVANLTDPLSVIVGVDFNF